MSTPLDDLAAVEGEMRDEAKVHLDVSAACYLSWAARIQAAREGIEGTLRPVADEMTRKMLEPVQTGPCQHADNCPGHYGEVHWLGLKHARDQIVAVLCAGPTEER